MKYYIKDSYEIEIYKEDAFDSNSTDNVNKYDAFYFDDSNYQSTTVFGIKISAAGTLLKSVVISGVGVGTGLHQHAVIVKNGCLVVCVVNSIVCFSIPDLRLLWRTKADTATCFGIFEYQEDYVVHGEVEISRLDSNGKILWQHSGADIFTTIDGKDDFSLTDEFILARDWDNKEYKFSYDGEILK